MCGRYSIVKRKLPKEHRFAAKLAGIQTEPRYYAAPSQALPVIFDKNEPAALFTNYCIWLIGEKKKMKGLLTNWL